MQPIKRWKPTDCFRVVIGRLDNVERNIGPNTGTWIDDTFHTHYARFRGYPVKRDTLALGLGLLAKKADQASEYERSPVR
jgi:hypothetical protein